MIKLVDLVVSLVTDHVINVIMNRKGEHIVFDSLTDKTQRLFYLRAAQSSRYLFGFLPKKFVHLAL